MDKKDDRPRGKSPDRDRRRSEARHETNRMDPHSVRCRIFIGNLATEKISRQELEDIFSKYGHIDGCSLHNNYGFVQYESEKAADEAVAKEDGRMILGKKLDVHLVSDKRRKGPPEPVRGGRGGRGGRDRPSPPRDRGRMDDFGGRYPSRFDHPEPEHYGRPLSPPRRGGFREPFDRPDDYHRDRYRDDPMRDPYDRRDLPPPRRPYDERRDPYDYPPRGEPRGEMRGDLRGDPRDPYYDRDVRRDDLRRDDFRHEGPPRGDPRRDDIRRDEPRRDEPYGRYDSYGRDYPDDYGPPLKKSRPESDSIYNKSIQAPTDCVVIVVNKILIDYGKMVERQFKDSGLVTDLQMLGMRSMAEVLDNITRHGVLYAVVVTSQHEVHRSVTVNILHGTPQEHRNMPLEDALSLVSRNFDQYMQDLRKRAGDLDKNKEKDYEKEREREKERPKEQDREREREREKSSRSSHEAPTVSKAAPHDDDMKKLLGKAASGGQLSSDELSKLIADLSKQKKQSEIQAGQGSSGGPSAPSQTQPPPTDTSSIAKQQADLQAKIFSILNPSTLSKVSLSVAQSASGAPPSSVAPAKTSGLSNPLFPAAKALAGSTSSGYNSQSTMSASAGPAGKMAYGSSAAANLSTKPTPSGSFGVPKAQAPASSSYGVPKAAVSTPSWYSGSQPATTQQTSPSFRNKPQPSTPSSTSYGVPKQSPTSFGVPKQSPTSYGVPKASPTNFGAPNSSSSFGGANSATSYGVPKASPPVQAPPRRGGFQQSGPSPSAGPPGRGANSNRGIMGAVPGRGMARGGPPPGVTAVRGAPPNIRGASANRGGLYHSRGPAPRGPSPGGMPGMGHPIRGGVPGGPRYGVPSFRPPTPQGAPISTVSGRGRQPPRY